MLDQLTEALAQTFTGDNLVFMVYNGIGWFIFFVLAVTLFNKLLKPEGSVEGQEKIRSATFKKIQKVNQELALAQAKLTLLEKSVQVPRDAYDRAGETLTQEEIDRISGVTHDKTSPPKEDMTGTKLPQPLERPATYTRVTPPVRSAPPQVKPEAKSE